jgi:UDP-2,3-diacylglucosamine hydrolase
VTRLLFVSDLHLHASRPAATARFLRFLRDEGRPSTRLYILGDLFESWVGDDARDVHADEVITGLRVFADTGAECAVMRGNRDFLLGEGFASAAGVRLLPDEARETIHGEHVLLLHGDQLCTDDEPYQRWRRRVRRPGLQRLFLALPGGWRRRIGARIRAASARRTAAAPPSIMDVNGQAVVAALQRHGARLMVHGHTHRPAIHALEIGGQPARRIVLGDWYEQGSVLRWPESGPELSALPFSR